MSATEFLSLATEALFLIIAVAVVWRAIRAPRRSNLDIAAFFGTIALALIIGDVADIVGGPIDAVAAELTFAAISILPLIQLRIADDFAAQPRWLMIGATLATAAIVVAGVLTGPDWPPAVILLPIGLFVLLGGYTTAVFLREARRGRGITGRRLTAAAIGQGLIAFVLMVVGIGVFVPAVREASTLVTSVAILGAATAFLAAFSPPRILRRAWQEPELLAFINSAGRLVHEPDEATMLRSLQALAAEALGSSDAVIGLVTEDGRLRYLRQDGTYLEADAGEFVAGQAFSERRPIFTADASLTDPDKAEMYASLGVKSVLAAPIVRDTEQVGVLSIYATQAPLFAEDDLRTAQLVADQIARTLESRELLTESARMVAREEAARAKEDFLSAAAHDLRSPLSSLQLQAEMLERGLERDGLDAHLARARQVRSSTRRIIEFVNDLLDATRADHGRLSGAREAVDLVPMAREVLAETCGDRHPYRIEAPAAVIGQYDGRRIRQVFTNLVGNAVKYSPEGGEVVVRIEPAQDAVTVSVEDRGIGVDPADVPNLFTRFGRGRHVDERRFSGLGLGLYICRRIVEEHDGEISIDSTPGSGTTVTFRLPTASHV